MGNLGDLFPENQIQQFINNHLKPGCVIRIEVTFHHLTKPKYLVLVADNDQEYLTFIINSETHPFIKNREPLAKCQVDIDATDHPFLDHDSKIACHEVLLLKRSDVIKEIKQDTGKIKGRISDRVLSEIVSAVKLAKTLSSQVKTTILAALENNHEL